MVCLMVVVVRRRNSSLELNYLVLINKLICYIFYLVLNCDLFIFFVLQQYKNYIYFSFKLIGVKFFFLVKVLSFIIFFVNDVNYKIVNLESISCFVN